MFTLHDSVQTIAGIFLMQLSENEMEVLRLLWQQAPQKPADLQAEFGWEIDNGTLRSVLVGMVDSGILKRRKEGKAFVYSPRMRRETLMRRMIARIADVFTDGSRGKLLMELASDESLSAEAIEELKRIAVGEEEGDR